MANKRNCDLTGASINPGDANYGRGSHLINVDDGIHLTVTPGRRDGGNQGIDLSPEGFAQALRLAAENILKKVAQQAEAKAEAMEAADAVKNNSAAPAPENPTPVVP